MTSAVAAIRVLLMVVVFIVPVLVTLQLKHMGELGIQAKRDLQAVATELQMQDGLEWRAISGRVAPPDVHPQLADSRARVDVLLAGTVAGGLGHGDEQVLGGLIGAYSRAVDSELRLLSAGEAEEAANFDEQQVDPAFERALDNLTEHAAEVRSRRANSATAGWC